MIAAAEHMDRSWIDTHDLHVEFEQIQCATMTIAHDQLLLLSHTDLCRKWIKPGSLVAGRVIHRHAPCLPFGDTSNLNEAFPHVSMFMTWGPLGEVLAMGPATGGVIMDVMNKEQAKIAEEAGACAVMALERIPADIRQSKGVARMSDPKMIKDPIPWRPGGRHLLGKASRENCCEKIC